MPTWRALPWLLAAMAVLPAAWGHGATKQVEFDEGPFHVRLATNDGITEGEPVRFGWEVKDRASGERVEVPEPRHRTRFHGLDGRLVEEREVVPEQPLPGILVADVVMGPRGRANHTLVLPQGLAVSYEHPVCWYGERGELACGQAPGSRPSPLPAGAALLALAGAGLALRRR